MEYLISDKERYAAAMLAHGFHGNVFSALREAERWEAGEFQTLVSNWEQYYLIYNSTWKWAYYVKFIPSEKYKHYRCQFAPNDDTIEAFKW